MASRAWMADGTIKGRREAAEQRFIYRCANVVEVITICNDITVASCPYDPI